MALRGRRFEASTEPHVRSIVNGLHLQVELKSVGNSELPKTEAMLAKAATTTDRFMLMTNGPKRARPKKLGRKRMDVTKL